MASKRRGRGAVSRGRYDDWAAVCANCRETGVVYVADELFCARCALDLRLAELETDGRMRQRRGVDGRRWSEIIADLVASDRNRSAGR